jgi:hypothetical protein
MKNGIAGRCVFQLAPPAVREVVQRRGTIADTALFPLGVNQLGGLSAGAEGVTHPTGVRVSKAWASLEEPVPRLAGAVPEASSEQMAKADQYGQRIHRSR